MNGVRKPHLVGCGRRCPSVPSLTIPPWERASVRVTGTFRAICQPLMQNLGFSYERAPGAVEAKVSACAGVPRSVSGTLTRASPLLRKKPQQPRRLPSPTIDCWRGIQATADRPSCPGRESSPPSQIRGAAHRPGIHSVVVRELRAHSSGLGPARRAPAAGP